MLATVLVTVLAAGLVPGAPVAWVPEPATASVVTCEGVLVVVDTAALPPAGDGSAAGSIGCAADDASAAEIDGLEALRGAGVRVDGTAQWGAAFVCRVDGRPGPAEEIALPGGGVVRESCERTPSAQAYWSLWTAGPDGAWVYAQAGVGDLALAPGDALGLAFAVGPDSPAPPAVSAADARAGVLGEGWSRRTGTPGDGPEGADAATGTDAGGPAGTSGTVLAVVAVALVVLMGLASVLLARRRR